MDDGTHQAKRLLVGDLILDVGRRRVTRDGKILDLPKRSFRLLHALAKAAPDVVAQDELVQQVWPGRVVRPETITHPQRQKNRAPPVDPPDQGANGANSFG